MKKIVKEEDARHVKAMHHVVSVEIRNGRENLKLVKPEVGFWLNVLKYEKKGGID